eukprot:4711435-Pleurochrysis_carterae.AAC.1
MSQATNEDHVPALVSDFLPLWISESEITDEAAAAFERKLTLSKINTTKSSPLQSQEQQVPRRAATLEAESKSAEAGEPPPDSPRRGGRKEPATEELEKPRITPADIAEYNLPACIYNFDLEAAQNHKEEGEFIKLCVKEVHRS